MSGDLITRYTFLADGTKVGAVNGTGDFSLEYLGSLVYKRVNGELQLESTAFGGGRINKASNDYEVNYFLTDHLGSTRVVARPGDSGVEIVERSDYYPFGSRHNTPNSAITDNRYRFSGKEDQESLGLSFQDFGARMYDAEIGRWWSLDPLSQFHSGYVYCGNNPLNLIDPTGMWGMKGDEVHNGPENHPLQLFIRRDNGRRSNKAEEEKQKPEEETPKPIIIEDIQVVAPPAPPQIGDRAMGPITGFWDYFVHYTGGRTYSYEYKDINIFNRTVTRTLNYDVDKNGYITRVTPNTGTPPLPGKVKATYIKGLKVAVDTWKFHRVIKPKILKEASRRIPNLYKQLGTNPNIIVKNGEIILESQNKLGRSINTGLKATEFFK